MKASARQRTNEKITKSVEHCQNLKFGPNARAPKELDNQFVYILDGNEAGYWRAADRPVFWGKLSRDHGFWITGHKELWILVIFLLY